MRTWMLGLLCFAGCAGGPKTSYMPSTPTAQVGPPRSSEQVELLTEMPARPHVQIGIVGGKWGSNGMPETIYAAMREEAARHRCDALVITGGQNYLAPTWGGGSSLQPGTGYVRSVQRYSGACLVYSGDAPAPASAGDSVQASAPSCQPVCSPGYRCEAGTCVAECNPLCSPGYVCAQDRTCQPAQVEASAAPAQ